MWEPEPGSGPSDEHGSGSATLLLFNIDVAEGRRMDSSCGTDPTFVNNPDPTLVGT